VTYQLDGFPFIVIACLLVLLSRSSAISSKQFLLRFLQSLLQIIDDLLLLYRVDSDKSLNFCIKNQPPSWQPILSIGSIRFAVKA
jgi:hypothetical protein